MAVSPLIRLAFYSSIIMLSNANEFLKAPAEKSTERVSAEDIRVSLLDEVESSLGKGSAAKRLADMEAILGPIVAALPKNAHGKLGHSAVRYALHRLFVLRHGWVIKDLGSADGAQNASSPAGVLTDHVPAYIEGLFEQRLAGKGFGLHEVAVLAATIEHLIHDEAVSKLGATFDVLELPVYTTISREEASEALDTYMMTYILGENVKNMTLKLARGLNAQMSDIFLAWPDTQKFVQEVRSNVTVGSSEDFATLAKVAEQVGEQFGTFQDLECRQLKDKLVQMEYRGTGRVKLSDFYKPAAFDGSWTFQESVGYLRALGLLDESDPNQPSVMIANYLTSQTNCIASSGFYSVCCKNECEGLLGHLEQNIGAFEAKPAAIASLIAKLPSSTITAPQKPAEGLLQRLDDIASTHGGMVPLHSRLFAQWMHHVYPRECPFPHISGTTDAQSAGQFQEESGLEAQASDEEMMQYVTLPHNTTDSETKSDLAVEEVMPWSSEEELLVVRPLPKLPTPWDSATSAPGVVRSAALLAAAGSLAFGLIQTMKGPLGEPASLKYLV